MTMQVAMAGRDVVVLASDKLMMRSGEYEQEIRATGFSSKIKISKDRRIAISCAKNMETAERIAERIIAEADEIDWVYPEDRIREMAKDVLKGAGERTDVQCLIVCTQPKPRIFRLTNTPGPSGWLELREEEQKAYAGDNQNSAIFWAERYYKPGLSVAELLRLSAHLIVTAGEINPSGVGGLELVICDAAGCHRFPDESLAMIESQSKAHSDELADLFSGPWDVRKFDAVLRSLLNSKPTTFKDVAAKPKLRKDGGIKRSAKKGKPTSPAKTK